ncbi:MAG: prephenate dehydratase [Flavobacteriaceae bacterium]|jgi:prephenate dehydratase|nr:prephenate dehydratase [Flavobacteriaceae bacterium]
MKKKIGIQGIRGSFHHIAVENYFDKEIKLCEYLSFEDMIFSLSKNEIQYALMAIENSTAGSIIPNYALIDEYNINIVGEHYLEISHNLMALKGQSLDDIKEIHSHPMALLQCRDFLKENPSIKLVEEKDTASVAKKISNTKTMGIGAIASKLAAKIYDLNLIKEDIQSIKKNQTRFVVLKKDNSLDKLQINKASLKFELDHKRGSLAAILNVLSDCKLNLTKIQSMPKIETPWRYSFFVDVTFENLDNYLKAKSIIQIMAKEFKVLGEYKNSKDD